MKNSINLVFAVLFFVILGCGCPRLDKLTAKKNPPNSGTPYPYNAATPPPPPTPPSTPVPQTGDSLTMEQYRKLEINMPMSEVNRILGGPGTEISSSSGGGVSFSVYKWSGPNYTSIIISFKNDKIMSKSQVGLK